MSNARGWQPQVNVTRHALPGQPADLAPPPERAAPVPCDIIIEGIDRPAVGGNGKVIEEAVHHLLQIQPLLCDRPVHHPLYRLFDLPEPFPQSFPNGVPQDEIASPLAGSADMREAEEGEGLRLATSLCLAIARRKAPEFNDPGFLRMQFQPELLQSLPKFVPKPLGIGTPLKAHHGVVGIADDDHVAVGVLPSPLVDPQVIDVMQIDVRQDRRAGSPNAKDNFRFERTILGWRGRCLLDLRRKR